MRRGQGLGLKLFIGAIAAMALFAGIGAAILVLVYALGWIGAWFTEQQPGHFWLGLGNIVALLLVVVMITATLLTLAERKWSAGLQNRIGPNRARIAGSGLLNRAFGGIPHILADTLKMIVKEDFIPPRGSKWLFNLAPVLAFAPAFALIVVVPFGPDVTVFGIDLRFQIARLDIGLLFIFAVASIAVYGTALAGWSSNNKFSLLGALRASAQMISYEVTLGLTIVGAFLLYETLRPEVIVAWQDKTTWWSVPSWGVFFQPAAALFFFVASAAEIKRAPFDLPEGESEIIGYFVEYSGMKFGLFMISEFAEVVVFAALFTAVFFGGHAIPWMSFNDLHTSLVGAAGAGWGGFLATWIALTVFVAKMMFFVWLQMMIRWTFPRFRYDQVMDLGWKILLPVSLANVVITAGAIILDPSLKLVLAIGLVECLVLAGVAVTASTPDRHAIADDSARARSPEPSHAH